MLKITDLQYFIGGKKLLDGVSFTLFNEKKVIVGENGSGKTTILEIITGKIPPEHGDIEIKGSFAYIPQEIKIIGARGIEVIDEAFADLKKIEKQLEALKLKENFGDEYPILLEKYAELGGFSTRSLILEKLNEIGLTEEIINKPFSEMSGGERTKCLLVRAMLMNPDMLIIDEPTNHLDIETIEYLEKFLISFKGGVLLVTHDKTLINKIANSILYLENGRIKEYPGNYEKFVEIKEMRNEQSRKEREKLLAYVEKNRMFIEKFRYGTRAQQAQSREKMLKRLEVPEVTKAETIKLSMESKRRGGEKVVEVKELYKSFNENEVLKGVNLTIFRGERVAIVGRNGSGKSTLLNIISGDITDYKGSVRTFESIDIAYFPQDAFFLDESSTMLDIFLKEGLSITEARNFLGNFNFEGDDVFKKVSELSGGEKRRLVIAKLALTKGNFMILDEPTNHLDIPTREAVLDALKKFDGTILIVTHDREILRELVNKTYYLEDGVLKTYEKENKPEQKKDNNRKEKNKIKSRIEYLERILKVSSDEKRERELRILREKLRKM